MRKRLSMKKPVECEAIRKDGKVIIRPKECDDMSAEKSNTPEFEWICPECGGKEYDANSLCLECGCRMISRKVEKNDKLS